MKKSSKLEKQRKIDTQPMAECPKSMFKNNTKEAFLQLQRLMKTHQNRIKTFNNSARQLLPQDEQSWMDNMLKSYILTSLMLMHRHSSSLSIAIKVQKIPPVFRVEVETVIKSLKMKI